MTKVLIVEDDAKLARLMGDSLSRYGYHAVLVEDFTNVEGTFQREKPDLVLLDVNLPYYDGFAFCRLFRRTSRTPILMISARSGDLEQVMGMELGADDYITKPFSIELLLAKVKAVLRRVYGEYAVPAGQSVGDRSLQAETGILLDERSFKLQVGERTAELTKNEFKLLKALLDRRDSIVSREELLSELWDDSSFVDDNTLTVNVTRVKAKLAELGLPGAIKTKRGVGYLLDSPSFTAGSTEGESEA